ncbi:MAG: lipoate--protein ligase family protein [Candidatus Helarchaeota archaeon]|nr:lipoate--protein ligase family protein [Candidatus Helarchaeota archaeon]
MVFNKTWRFFLLKNLEPIRLQAIYHALALSISNTPKINALILSTTNKSSISCGYHQNYYEEVDLEYCRKNKIELVRRTTGGGLVLLEQGQVFYNVILNGFGFPSPFKNLYSISLKGPNQFLRNLNLNSEIYFNEIQINNRKISGNGAISIENTGVMAGNILLDFNYEKFCKALNVPSDNFRKLTNDELEKNITTLNKELDRIITVDETIEGLKTAFETTFKTKFREDELKDFEIEILEEVEMDYKEETWNFRKKDEKNKLRHFIKIKKDACIVHYAPYKADFLISNEIIDRIKISDQLKDIEHLKGKNIYKIKDSLPKFAQLQDKLIKYYELANI